MLTVVMAQLNFMLADMPGNANKIIAAAKRARDEYNADVIVFPELALCAYPPEDLLFRPAFHREVDAALARIREQVEDIVLVIGHPYLSQSDLYNSASVIHNAELLALYHKQHLPNYSVFDEKRYFTPGTEPCVVDIKGIHCGICICEDLWHPGPLSQAVEHGAELMLCLNASPYHLKKPSQREDILRKRQHAESALPIVYVNCVGGQDELIFDGGSLVMDAQGNVTHKAPPYVETLIPVTFEKNETLTLHPGELAPTPDKLQMIYDGLVLGTRDYVRKNGFESVLIGLSGGIDSALTTTIAVDALGADKVEAVMMPSEFTSDMSLEDASALAKNLKVTYRNIPIDPCYQSFLTALENEFKDLPHELTEENIQARSRGIILMALSNKFSKLVLSTGNKSEMAVGYATLYGDMVGAFAVLKDIPKTMVYDLAQYRNECAPVIPQRIIDRPPSAELRLSQTDQDSLPPYERLDKIMQLYVEHEQSPDSIIQAGYDAAMVNLVVRLIDKNEYKRRQAPPGIRISPRAFGRDWRYPITRK